LIVQNTGETAFTFKLSDLSFRGLAANVTIPSHAITTYIF